MQMSSTDISSYPKLAHYVKNDIPKLITVPAIVVAMNSVAQINKARLNTVLSWGNGPQIKITALSGAYGEFSPGISSNEIRVDTGLVTDFEAGRGKRVVRAGNAYLIGITLLHELVHWGDDQDGIDRPGEEGAEFERLVYGAVIV